MDPSLQDVQGLRIAVEGCGHGTLNAIYSATDKACEARSWDGVDLLIIGGDFQAVRNAYDLTVMSVPAKFREIGDFHEYYSGRRRAPYLTIFVGGNHEASSHLWELYYGGWVAPNIYYMGAANVVRLGPVRIAGMSGIWKGYNYNKPHHERLPYNQDDIKSIYHVRELDIRKLLQLRTQVDVGISHDWPRAIERHGDERHLFRLKPDFEQESKDGTLGNQAATYVMDRLRPPYWFAAHMHCKFAATKTYPDQDQVDGMADGGVIPTDLSDRNVQPPPVSNGSGAVAHNVDEIDLDMDDEDDQPGPTPTLAEPNTESTVPEDVRALLPASFSRPIAQPRRTPGGPPPPSITNRTVRFLALDKCLPGRKFLQLLEILPSSPSSAPLPAPTPSPDQPRYHLCYDPEWLAITRVFAPSLTLGDRSAKPDPDLGEEAYLPRIEAEAAWVDENVVKAGKMTIPENFEITAPVHEAGMPESVREGPGEYNNPQTVAFCELVGIENRLFATEKEREERMTQGPAPPEPRREGGFGAGRGGRRDGGRGGGRGRGRGGGRGFGSRGNGSGRGRRS
ncbi:MAG: hypothetical protein M1818_001823 [Claussenomyces sp. TS43310]|nr:MAG: hypothetical protein M1818_001823 [Claussenomyces sp. TS43310]